MGSLFSQKKAIYFDISDTIMSELTLDENSSDFSSVEITDSDIKNLYTAIMTYNKHYQGDHCCFETIMENYKDFINEPPFCQWVLSQIYYYSIYESDSRPTPSIIASYKEMRAGLDSLDEKKRTLIESIIWKDDEFLLY